MTHENESQQKIISRLRTDIERLAEYGKHDPEVTFSFDELHVTVRVEDHIIPAGLLFPQRSRKVSVYELHHPFALRNWIVPAGFRTDFASVPRFLHPIFPPMGLCSRAAVIHDFLYRSKNLHRSAFGETEEECKQIVRKYADELFLEVLKEDGVRWWRRWCMYFAVRMFGGRAFREDCGIPGPCES